MGNPMDAVDVPYYYRLFLDELRRDPTDVEMMDIAQSNSEHSRQIA